MKNGSQRLILAVLIDETIMGINSLQLAKRQFKNITQRING